MNKDIFYSLIGEKIKGARENGGSKLSQAKLATRLGLSRASVVNIEAGRQHAPLHVIWQIAKELGIELSLLIPTDKEYNEYDEPMKLDAESVEKIENAANGDAKTRQLLTQFVRKAKAR